ncbi:hypothetical protein C8J57DRAFT_1456045 [Mycena rebaudengoi]|nr:hypothetical protein C8J57DRAFT_1456045 [Mycena rebaudengoi]
MFGPKCTAEDLANPDFGYFFCPSFPPPLSLPPFLPSRQSCTLFKPSTIAKSSAGCSSWPAFGRPPAWRSVCSGAPHPTSATFGFPSQLLILLAPIWINAFDYVVMSRVVWFFSPDKRVLGITARRLALIFVLLDITAFLMQAAGGSNTNNDDPKVVLMGLHIYMGGIGLQECFVLLFIGIVTRPAPGAWKRAVYPMYASLALITLRIIFRLVEFSSGVISPITQSEVPFYVLEALPMFVALALWNVWHPGRSSSAPTASSRS